jgi:hypothetical protein
MRKGLTAILRRMKSLKATAAATKILAAYVQTRAEMIAKDSSGQAGSPP